MDTMKPTTQRKLFRLPQVVSLGRYVFTHVMACIQVAVNGRPLGQPGHSLLGRYMHRPSMTYSPNGKKECARRRRQIKAGTLRVTGKAYTDSVDYGDGVWDHREYVT